MNLLMVLHQYLPRHVTGTEQYVRSLALGFTERGHNVRIFTFEPMIQAEAPGRNYFEHDDQVDGIPVRRVAVHPELVPNRHLADYDNPLASQMLGRLLDQHPADLVHVFHPRLIGLGAILEPAARGIPVVVNLMDFWFICPNFLLLQRGGDLCEGPPNGGLGCIPCLDPGLAAGLDTLGITDELGELAGRGTSVLSFESTLPRRAHALVGRKEHLFETLLRADEVIAPSLFLQSVFEGQGFPGGRIRHVPYGIDNRRFRGRAPRPPLSERSVLDVGYVGSLTPHKGVHVLVDAVRQTASDRLRLHIHGGHDAHPEYSESLRGLADDDPRIVFHSAFAPDALGDVLAGLDLLVVPSLWYENTPFSILEAMHVHVPVAASDLGGISELLQHGVNGFLFRRGDSSSLADVLEGILEDPARLSDLNVAPEQHDIKDNLDVLEALYTPLLEGATRS